MTGWAKLEERKGDKNNLCMHNIGLKLEPEHVATIQFLLVSIIMFDKTCGKEYHKEIYVDRKILILIESITMEEWNNMQQYRQIYPKKE